MRRMEIKRLFKYFYSVNIYDDDLEGELLVWYDPSLKTWRCTCAKHTFAGHIECEHIKTVKKECDL